MYRRNGPVGENTRPRSNAQPYCRSDEMIAFLRRLLGFVKPYRNRLIFGILSGVLYGLANTALLVVVKVVIDLVFPVAGRANLDRTIAKCTGVFAPSSRIPGTTPAATEVAQNNDWNRLVVSTIPAMMLLRGLCAYLNFYLLNWVAVRAIMDLRTKLFAHLQNLSLSFFHTSSTGDLISRISNDTATLHKIISNTFPVMVRSPIAVLGLVILLFTQQPKLTLVSLAVIPICVVPIVVYGRKGPKIVAGNSKQLCRADKSYAGSLHRARGLSRPTIWSSSWWIDSGHRREFSPAFSCGSSGRSRFLAC
jgi:subfamily B ATP-binding cassette protein MsbA